MGSKVGLQVIFQRLNIALHMVSGKCMCRPLCASHVNCNVIFRNYKCQTNKQNQSGGQQTSSCIFKLFLSPRAYISQG